MGNLLSSLLEFLIRCFCRNSWKLCKDYKELNAFSKSKASKFPDLIPLEPIYHFLEVILIIFLIFIGTGLITVPVAIFSMDGVTTEFFFSISFFCLLLGLVLFPLFNIDSRYVLDMKHKQLLYVFSFLDYQRKKVVMPFSDILAIGVESHEAGSAGIVYRLEIANKNFKRLPICKNSYSYENLDEVAPMLAKALDCQFGLKEYPARDNSFMARAIAIGLPIFFFLTGTVILWLSITNNYDSHSKIKGWIPVNAKIIRSRILKSSYEPIPKQSLATSCKRLRKESRSSNTIFFPT